MTPEQQPLSPERLREMRGRALAMKQALSECVGGDGKPAFENSQSEHVLLLLSELAASRAREKVLMEALEAAAKSLESAASMAASARDPDERLSVHGYATNRASVARAALSPQGNRPEVKK